MGRGLAYGFLSGIFRRIVAGTSAHQRTPRRVYRDLDLTEASVKGLNRGRVGNGVLIPDVVRHLKRDSVHVRYRLRIEGQPAGFIGQRVQRPLADLGFVALFFVQESDRVDQNLALPRSIYDFFEVGGAGVVVAIRHYQEHLLVPLALTLQVVDRHANRIAHLRATAGIDASHTLFQRLDVVR